MTKKPETAMSQSNRAFILLEIASSIGILGGSMVFMLLPWAAINLSHSSFTAGLMISISNVPGLLLSPVMGSFIDKFGRHRSAVILQAAPIITSLAFAIVAATGNMSVPMLFVLATARGVLAGGSMSARKSLIPDAVRGTSISLEKANSLHESIAAGGFAIGPALAAVLVNLAGIFNAFYVVAFMEALAVAITLVIRVREHTEPHHSDEEARHWIHYLLTGFKVMFRAPSVLILMGAFTLLATIYLPTEMVVLPNYYASIHDAQSMGFLLFDMAAFTMVGAFFFERIARRFSFAAILRFALLGVALPMIPMAFLPPQPIMFICGAILGFAWGPLPPLVNTVVQRKIPASQRGRVFSLEATIWTGGPMITMSLVGWGVDALGVRSIYGLLAGLVTLAAVLLATRAAVKDLNTAEFVEEDN
ncbi:MAG: MFS transporter [Micrococcales bacterium]